MLSQKHQLYLAIIVLVLIGVFFFPDVYKDAETEHEFCCSSFDSKIVNIRLDSNDYWILELGDRKEYHFDKFLSTEDVEAIAIGDSIVKNRGSLAMTVYSNQQIKREINKESASGCECE